MMRCWLLVEQREARVATGTRAPSVMVVLCVVLCDVLTVSEVFGRCGTHLGCLLPSC